MSNINPANALAAIANEYASLLLDPNAEDYQQRYSKIADDIREVAAWLES